MATKPAVTPRPGSRAVAATRRRAAASTVGVRELRQNLSVYLDQVKRGAVLQVTEHGHVVATLQPPAAAVTRLERLAAQGLVTRARKSIRDLPAPRRLPPGSPSVSELLDELRADRL